MANLVKHKTMKYIDADKLKEEIERLSATEYNDGTLGDDVTNGALDYVLEKIIPSLQQEQIETDKYDCPSTPIEEAVEVTSRMEHIDEELKPIANFIMNYASWNLHKDEWNQPVIEVPLFRALDALVQRGKPYCCSN